MKKFFAVTLVALLLFGLIFGVAGCATEDHAGMEEVRSVQWYKKEYSADELHKIAAADFLSLNEIDYDLPYEVRAVTEKYVDAIKTFSDRLYAACIAQGDVGMNFAFSPIGVYEILHLLLLASENESVRDALTDLIGVSCEEAKTDFINAYKNDYFSNEFGTLRRYNGAFFSKDNAVSTEYLQELTDRYVDAYQMNFQSASGVDKMVAWVNERLREEGFLKEEDLDLTSDTSFVFFSTMFFDNGWAHSFLTDKTYEDTFFGEVRKKASFMRHTYHGRVYDYGSYVSCYDYYANGMSVKYFTPKEKTEDIFALLDGKSLFFDDPGKEILGENGLIVDLSVPKFSAECSYTFDNALKSLGQTEMYRSSSHAFDKMYTDLTPAESIYLSFIKSKSKVSFSEDGTIVKSYIMAQGEKASSVGPGAKRETIEIKLDSPFAYVIYDRSGIPLYVGRVENV
ncbi:MAG: hypothetical protein IJ735_03890 [Clostridia bacterium]|nr:hypothetical protein [Clostridia bacterium]